MRTPQHLPYQAVSLSKIGISRLYVLVLSNMGGGGWRVYIGREIGYGLSTSCP